MLVKYVYSWEEELGLAIVTIHENGMTFVGTAKCHEQDQDMKSEKVGTFIALNRAQIKHLTYIINKELKPQLKAIETMYNEMAQCKNFNPKSFEARRMRKKMYEIKDDIAELNEFKQFKITETAEYIKVKEDFYQKARKHRGLVKEG